jgi:tetratricopeptide (TPR) repeat protein
MLADARSDLGDYKRAHDLARECLSLARETGDPWLNGQLLILLGELARIQGDYDQALSLYSERLALMQQVGDRWSVAVVFHNIGQVAQHQGDYVRARALHVEALKLHRELGAQRGIALGLEKLAGVAGAQWQPARAARLLGAAEALRQAVGSPVEGTDRPDYERFVAVARAGLDEKSFASAWAEGRAMTLEQAIRGRHSSTLRSNRMAKISVSNPLEHTPRQCVTV